MAVNKKSKKTPNTYTWSGVDKDKRNTSGEIEAFTIHTAKALLQQKGIRASKIRKQSKPLFSFGQSIKTKDIVFFTRQLSTMMTSGIAIAQSLKSISYSHDKSSVKKLLNMIRESVETGTNLSTSLKNHPKHFNKLYTTLVAAGEESGTLDVLMTKIATYMEKMEEIKRKIRSALVYPAIVILIAFIVILIMMNYVIPQFASLFASQGQELPALTAWMVGASQIVQNNWLIGTIMIVLTIILLIFTYKKSPPTQLMLDRLILKFPVFGPILRKAIIARITRTLATMFGAGVTLVDALETVANVAGNQVYTNSIKSVRNDISTGRSLENSMAATKLYPGMVLQMVATGEESGALETMLDKTAEFYEIEVDDAVDMMSTLIEPFLIVTLGLIVGTILVAMYMPIFQMGNAL